MKHTTLYEGKFLKLVHYQGWEFVKRTDCTGIVVIVPVTDRGEVVLVEQFRIPINKRVIELPAGLVGDKKSSRRESMAVAAKRELLEETGFRAGKITFLMEGPVSSGMSGQQISFYLASQLKKVGPGGGDETEDIQTHVIPLSKIPSWIRSMQKKGRLVDPKIFAGLYFVQSAKRRAQSGNQSL